MKLEIIFLSGNATNIGRMAHCHRGLASPFPADLIPKLYRPKIIHFPNQLVLHPYHLIPNPLIREYGLSCPNNVKHPTINQSPTPF